jgi:hypothetical protein
MNTKPAQSKPTHQKVSEADFILGTEYELALNGTPLYRARVEKFHGGCWATVQVTSVVSTNAVGITPGMVFDIKVAEYQVTPL